MKDKKNQREAKPARETNPAVLRKAMLSRHYSRSSARGELILPAIPAMLEDYVQSLAAIFAAAGRGYSAAEIEQMRKNLERPLTEGFRQSPSARIRVVWQTDPAPRQTLSYEVALAVTSVAEEYARWVETRPPPLFGTHPDSKVMALASELGDPATVPVLDVGAGTGRNTLPLARAGHAADALELAPAFAKIIRDSVQQENLAVRVFEGDVLNRSLEVPENHYKLVILAEVIASHIRDTQHLRALFERLAEFVAPGGILLFSAFLAAEGYKPDALARQLSEAHWCNLFTRKEVADGMLGLGFDLLSDESAYDFEFAHLPPEAWPPTGWYPGWSSGLELFDLPREKSPMELRWVAYRKRG